MITGAGHLVKGYFSPDRMRIGVLLRIKRLNYRYSGWGRFVLHLSIDGQDLFNVRRGYAYEGESSDYEEYVEKRSLTKTPSLDDFIMFSTKSARLM
ncbi:hypothetical protein CEXT_501741 [Caerostris extrusa]|uniref:Uncharacterized protein n=1 Tax=Caerostris extrusa TaxID=172846 RepID=A0AAV4P5P8_CAEEX|nr:hypothetical protein CEXT_501741 [Caerostris extrusa]